MSDYEDIIDAVEDRTASLTINRPEKYNAFRPRTVVEALHSIIRDVPKPVIAKVHGDAIRGMGQFAMQAPRLYDDTEESQEGVQALMAKRNPDFMKYYK